MFCVGSFLTMVMGDGDYADDEVDWIVLLMLLLMLIISLMKLMLLNVWC